MSPDLLSEAELVRLTSRLVAAHCRSQPMDATDLPGLIASVSRSLRARDSSPTEKASAPSPKSRAGSKAGGRTAVAAPQRAPTLSGTNVVHLSDFVRARFGTDPKS
jgi:hypothetical protein